MSDDTTTPEALPPDLDLWHLPQILDLSVRRAHYRQPKLTVRDGEVREVREAVEITIQTDSEFPVRALAPVLYVGQEVIMDSERIGENRYRFLADEPQKLKANSAIALGWPNRREAAKKTRFRYNLKAAD